nr:hypothetical protein Iba_chr06cCG11530 [Ipomoea batatas]
MSAIEEHDALTGDMNVLIEVESTSSIDHSYAILESNTPSSFKSNIVFSTLAPTLAPHLPFNPSGLKPIPGIIIVITGISSTPIFFLSSVRPEISSTIPNTASDGSGAEVV